MNDDEWNEAQELFLRLLDLEPEVQRRELERCAAEDPARAEWVGRLLKLEPGSELQGGPDEPSEDARAGRRLGPYELLRSIGRGGMGEVFVARRADGEYESEVAVKVLRSGAASAALVERFLRERQTLASLDHEYVAKLLDGGTTEDGEPYLVMEYVDGEPVDAFADRLELRERLELFVRVCEAVQHAHERGVVHRDLKPANVIVRADGKPRLLDFGIAQAEAVAGRTKGKRLTRTGHRLFTPEFASPEQIRGEPATPRSDVFALGVLLYVILAGRSPWKHGEVLHELEREICEDDPPPPSRRLSGTARRRLSGDLDAIALQCVEKRPERRYDQAGDLGADLGRFLEGKPVRARRVGTVERVTRYVQREPLVVMVGTLVTIAAITAWFAWIASERGRTSQEDLHSSVSDRIWSARARIAAGDFKEATRELETALEDLHKLPPDPNLEAAIYAERAECAAKCESWSASLEMADLAEAAYASVEPKSPVTLGKILNARAASLRHVGDEAAADRATREAVELARGRLPAGHPLRSTALSERAHHLVGIGRTDEALELLAEGVGDVKARDPRDESLAVLLNQEARVLADSERYAESVPLFEEALDVVRWHRGERHHSLAKIRLNYASALWHLDRGDEARREYERGMEAFRAREDERSVAVCLLALARIHLAQDDPALALDTSREALSIRETYGDMDPALVDEARGVHGVALARAGHAAEARVVLKSLLESGRAENLAPATREAAERALAALGDD